MTKAQELAALDAFIASLPPATYLRPWLSRVRDEVAYLVRCDVFPEIDLATAAENARKIHAEAVHNAGKIREDAEREASRILVKAREEADTIKAVAIDTAKARGQAFARQVADLRRALDALPA